MTLETGMLLRILDEVVEVTSEPVAEVRRGEMVWRFDGRAYYTRAGCNGRVLTRSSYVVPHGLLGVPGGVELVA